MERHPKIPPIKNLNILPSMSRMITARHVRGTPTGHSGRGDTLAYCVSGFSILHINGQNLLLRPNQMVFSPHGTWRGRTALSENLVIHEVGVAGDIEGQNIFEYLHLREDNYIVDVPEAYHSLVTHSFDVLLGFSSYIEDYLFRSAATANLIGIFFAARTQRQKNEKTFESVLSHMQAHIADNVKLSELAALMHMQPTYFIRSFKKTFQQSPIAYYNVLRVATAIDLLATTDLPLYKIAERIGISDQYYFSNFFKTQCSISPNQYREAAKSIMEQIDT